MISVLAVVAAEITVGTLVDEGALEEPQDALVFRKKVNRVKNEFHDESIVILGNSRAGGILPKMLAFRFFNQPVEQTISLAAGGAMPITYCYMLDALDDRCIKKGSLILLCLTPMCFNRNNACMQRTIMSYFSFPQFFSELVSNLRFDNVCYFLNHCSMDLLRYQKQVSMKVKRRLFSFDTTSILIKALNASQGMAWPEKPNHDGIDPALTQIELDSFENKYYVDYTLDPYQVSAVQNLLDRCASKRAQAVIVMLPLSKSLRSLLGEDHLKCFAEKVVDLARLNEVPVLDYLTPFSGEEYDFYDTSHLTNQSVSDFTKKLASDLRELAERYNSPILGFSMEAGVRPLKAFPSRFSASRGDTISFKLNASPSNRGRKYLLLGSQSGDRPGVRLRGKPYKLPLNLDLFSSILIEFRDLPVFEKFSGALNPEGMAEAKLKIPKSLFSNLVGTSMWFSFVLTSPIDFASNPVRIDIAE